MKKINLFAAFAAMAAMLAACTKTESVTAEVSVSPATVTFEAEGGTLKAAVSTNMDSYSVTGNPEWLAVAQNGNEISLTAEANTVSEERSATLTVTAGDATCSLAVKQKAGSPYLGFTVAARCEFEYSGTMLYQFLKPVDGYDGGQGYLIFDDEDGNELVIWLYTDLFESEEEVELPAGTYSVGQDEYPTLYAKKMTYMAGTLYSIDDEEFAWGSYYTESASGAMRLVKDGFIEVIEDENGMTVKADLIDADGKSLHFVYTGEVEINTDGAGYPTNGDRIDVANTVFAATCYYMGDDEDGKTRFDFTILSGDEDNYACTTYALLVDHVEYSEDYDISGQYMYDSEAEDADAEGLAGTIIPGELLEYEGFSFPSGTYVMYAFGDYLIGDSYDTLNLEKQDDGTYTFSGIMMSATTDEMLMFLDVNVPVTIADGRDSGEDD